MEHKKTRETMEPEDVVRTFESLALDLGVELEVDDALAGLAMLLTSPALGRRERVLLTEVGATLYRTALNEQLHRAIRKR